MRVGKSDLTDEHLVRTGEGVVFARSVRRLAEHSWSEENLRAVVETPQKRKATTVDIPLAAEPLAPPLEAPEVPEDEKEEPKAKPEEDEEMQGDPSETEKTLRVPSSSRGEKRTEPQQNVFAKKRVMMKSPKRPATLATPSDDLVKRRVMKKTDTKCSCQWKVAGSDLLHAVNALFNDETGEEAKPWSDESEKTGILTVLVCHHKEMMKGRQKELSSLKDMSAMTAAKRSEAVGKRAPQTRWVDRERRLREVQAGSEGLQSKSGAYSARDVLTDTIDTVSENNVGCKFT